MVEREVVAHGSTASRDAMYGAAEDIIARNLQAHRLVVEAVNAREIPDDLLAPGFWMENRLSSVTDYEYHGAQGLRDWMDDVFEVFADGARYVAEEIVASGHDHIAAVFCVSGRGGQSGLPLEFRWTGVTWFHGGRPVRAVGYATRDDALRALAEKGMSIPAPQARFSE